jgi:hypothetical protein
VAGLWWHPIGVAAAAGMAALLIGARLSHRRPKDSGKDAAPALVTMAITVAYLVFALAGDQAGPVVGHPAVGHPAVGPTC